MYENKGRRKKTYSAKQLAAQEMSRRAFARAKEILGARGCSVQESLRQAWAEVKGVKAAANPRNPFHATSAKDLLQQALNQEHAAAFGFRDKATVKKLESLGLVQVLSETPKVIRFKATERARTSRAPWSALISEGESSSSRGTGLARVPRLHDTGFEELENPRYGLRPLRTNPGPSIVEKGGKFHIYQDGVPTGKYFSSRVKAKKKAARM